MKKQNKIKREDDVTNFPKFNEDTKSLMNFAYKSENKLITDCVNMEITRRLILAINKFDRQSSKQTFWVILLTIAIFVLGIIQTIILISQIF